MTRSHPRTVGADGWKRLFWSHRPSEATDDKRVRRAASRGTTAGFGAAGSCLDPFEDRGQALAATDAHRLEGVMAIAALELAQQGGEMIGLSAASDSRVVSARGCSSRSAPPIGTISAANVPSAIAALAGGSGAPARPVAGGKARIDDGGSRPSRSMPPRHRIVLPAGGRARSDESGAVAAIELLGRAPRARDGWMWHDPIGSGHSP